MIHKGSNVAKKIDAWVQKLLEEHGIQKFSGGARDPEVPGGAHDPMRDDVDSDEALVPRVPNLLPEPSARQIAEHELTGPQCTESGVVIALRRRVERIRIPHERKESCLK